jgi:mannose-6-phosphate isomerase
MDDIINMWTRGLVHKLLRPYLLKSIQVFISTRPYETAMDAVVQLECQCNNYPWGKIGTESLAAQYAAVAPGSNFQLDNNKPYAEMWMGTYPKTPSRVLSTGEDLQTYLDEHKKLIGTSVLTKFHEVLPFLPKVVAPKLCKAHLHSKLNRVTGKTDILGQNQFMGGDNTFCKLL